MNYIEINKELAPYSFEIELSGNVFRFEVYYNERFDYFTIDLLLEDKPLLYGEKLILDSRMFAVLDYKELLDVKIIPQDTAEIESRVSFDNLNKQVFVYLEGYDE